MRYNADTSYELCVQLSIVMKYHMPPRGTCAIASEHQFYPMPVWPKSGIVNGMPKNEDVHPYPGTLHDSVKEKLAKKTEEINHARQEAMIKRAKRDFYDEQPSETSGAASSVADDE